MGKSKKRTVSTIVTMVVVAIIVLLLYFYLAFRMDLQKETSVEELSEVEKLLDKDLELNYPETPREVIKLHSNMMKTLYTELEDEEVEALALKIRELYDTEFLETKSEGDYLKDLYSEIAEWKDSDRKISYFHLVNEELEQESIIDGRKLAAVYVSYTIQEKDKFLETWRFLLRQSEEDEKWKILGWEFVPEEEEVKE